MATDFLDIKHIQKHSIWNVKMSTNFLLTLLSTKNMLKCDFHVIVNNVYCFWVLFVEIWTQESTILSKRSSHFLNVMGIGKITYWMIQN